MPSGHRRFAAYWDRASRHEPARIREMRGQTASRVSGRVLEVGVGTGANWPYLPRGIEYTGIEPDPHMLERARRHAAEQGRELTLSPYDVRDLPFGDASFDSVLITLTLCSVDEPVAGLRELYRVLRPGGELWFVEHVRFDHSVLAAVQSAVRPVTRYCCGGCEWDHDSAADIGEAGFAMVELHREGGIPPVIRGCARRPG